MPDERKQEKLTRSVFRVCYIHDEIDSEPPKTTRLVEIIRDIESRDVQVQVFEEGEIASLKWIPEVVYRMKEAGGDILDVVIRPRLDVLSNQTKKIPDFSDDSHVVPHKPMPETKPDVTPGAVQPPAVFQDDEVIFEVTFENMEIKVNGLRLSKVHFDNENEVVFGYIYRNPKRKILLSEIEEAIERPINKKLYDIVRAIGFKGGLKNLFFPYISKTAIEFINPMTKAEFKNRNLQTPQVLAKSQGS